ncbi:MAG: CHAP domain-containing protein [Oscillospiraceae bacterium]|nr:CHAP domain-containing protein [Oscillospiraceae bacterium]
MLSIINLAVDQIGNDYKTYCYDMGYSYRIEWCACFISWLAKKCNRSDIPCNMSCTGMINELKQSGNYKYKTGTPYPGYPLFYDWEKDNDPDHVGIVESVNGSYVTVIEGNNGKKPNDRVRRRTIKYSDPQVYGWGGPRTSTVSQPSGVPAEVSGANPDMKWDNHYDKKIEELQRILNRKGCGIEVDGQAGPETYKAVSNYTIELYDMGPLTRWVQERLNEMGFNCGEADGYAEPPTMSGIADFQKKYKLGVGYLGGTDWYYIIK